jgi:hypothetical protein
MLERKKGPLLLYCRPSQEILIKETERRARIRPTFDLIDRKHDTEHKLNPSPGLRCCRCSSLQLEKREEKDSLRNGLHPGLEDLKGRWKRETMRVGKESNVR